MVEGSETEALLKTATDEALRELAGHPSSGEFLKRLVSQEQNRREYVRHIKDATSDATSVVKQAIVDGLRNLSEDRAANLKGYNYFGSSPAYEPNEVVVLFKDGIGIKITVEVDHLPEVEGL